MKHGGRESLRAGSVGARVSVGAGVVVGGNLLERILGVISIAVLGRLLTPEDFGIVALALVIVGVGEALENGQFRWALIRIPEPGRDHYSTVFALQLLLGGALSIGIFLVAPAAASLMQTPALEDALRWLALVPILANLRNPYSINFQRELRFVPGMIMGLGGRLASTATAIGLAYALGDYRAMVAAAIVFVAVRTALTYAMMPILPGLSLARWREFVGFGGWLSASGLVDLLGRRADVAIMGLWLDLRMVGLFNMGKEITNLAVRQFAGQARMSMYPGMALIADDPDRYRKARLKTVQTLVGVLTPIGVGMALVAEEFVALLIGEQWSRTVPVIQALAPVAALAGLVAAIHSDAMVRGDTRGMFLRDAAIAVLQLPVLAFAIWRFGLMGAIWGRVVVELVSVGLMLDLSRRLSGETFVAPLAACWRSFAAAAAMVIAVLVAAPLAPTHDNAMLAMAMALATKASVGASVYLLSHIALWRLAGAPEGFERACLTIAGKTLVAARSRLGR